MRKSPSKYGGAVWRLVGIVTGGLAVPLAAAAGDNPAGGESALVAQLLDMAGMSKGVCSVLGCEDGKVALELAGQADFLVHVWEPRAAAVAAARELLDGEGLHGKQVVVETGSFKQLPYGDHTVDLLLAVHLTDNQLDGLPCPEVLRVLRPKGKAILGRSSRLHGSDEALTRPRLQGWLRAAGTDEAAVREDGTGLWAQLTKPPLKGTDEWSHWEHGPDNNPVSTDAVIKAPYITQWLGQPYYIAMPAITVASAGKTFIAMGHIAHHKREEPWLNTLMARNGYNGTVLWTRRLPDGYLAHRSAFIATPDTFYMIDNDGRGCLLLDPETGEEKGRIQIPEIHGEWKWIALQDGVLYLLVGEEKDPAETTIVRSKYSHWSWGELSKGYYEPQVPWGFGTRLLAYDVSRKKLLWTHQEDGPVDSRAMVLGGGRLYFYAPGSHTGCLDAVSGKPVWTNDDPQVPKLIEEPGRGLTSTPGFRTTCYCLYTPKALFYEAQTHMNIVAVSLEDGSYLWHRNKTTSNPNMMYLEDRLLVGIGPNGSTLVLDPMTGETIEDLGFAKRSCARLTATPDSLFCRGWPEGLTRYDRTNKKILFNGAFRPSCNDGMIPANGLLYAGPWLCDCNLSLMGSLALCSAGGFEFEPPATEARRLEVGPGDIRHVAPLDLSDNDWPTYRGNLARSAATRVPVPEDVARIWEYRPRSPNNPTPATAAAGLIFLGADDGKVRALEAATGRLRWSFLTAGPIMQPPTIWNGRAYFGSGDGYIYAVEAATGRLLWRFRAAPVDRRIMVYGALCSTWPVNIGVLVKDGVAYAAAGIIDYDGTYVYALDAVTGEIKWQNAASGHLDKQLRKGVSAQGVLTVAAGRLWMPGGNVISPAAYDLKTGEYLAGGPGNGSPRANRGEEIGVLKERYVILGGRLRYSAERNVVNPGNFAAIALEAGGKTGRAMPLNTGKIPPAWNDSMIAMMQGPDSVPECCETQRVQAYLAEGDSKARLERLWRANWLKGSDTVSLALAGEKVLLACESPRHRWLSTQWRVCCLRPSDGGQVWQRDLPSPALTGGLLIDRDGRVVVVMDDGGVACYGGEKPFEDYVAGLVSQASDSDRERQKAADTLLALLKRERAPKIRRVLIARLEELGVDVGAEARKQGMIVDWQLLGTVPWDKENNPIDKVFIGEPDVDTSRTHTVGKQKLRWREYTADDLSGRINLRGIFGGQAYVAAYAYAEVRLTRDQDLLLKIGSDDGFKCWLNGEEVGRFDVVRGYRADQDVLKVRGLKGLNKILLKVTQSEVAWEFSARLTDRANKPLDLSTE